MMRFSALLLFLAARVRASVPTQEHLGFLQRVESDVDHLGAAVESDVAFLRRMNPQKSASVSFVVIALEIFLFVTVAMIYDRYRLDNLFPQQPSHVEGKFKYGLFCCFEDWRLCLFTFFCWPVRWADNVDKSQTQNASWRWLTFWRALAVAVLLDVLIPVTGGFSWIFLVMLGTLFRIHLRERQGLESNAWISFVDCISWYWCSPCAVCQEARVIESSREKTKDLSENIQAVHVQEPVPAEAVPVLDPM
uniref:Uncharacterized protein n=1 Tax=Noctiluca scintillans TaxID=2966 RepID=A0A7S1FH86_NOCSC|mmetsp:Transcript_60902/g.161739  ORF Transcript_60902/g.161739 Transcript_60902/m.161739 type:complete len:249 (+) Transcript_60902:66-812(+)